MESGHDYRLRLSSAIIAREVPAAALVVEIGGADATFKERVAHESWVMVDKFGSPDVIVDVDGPETRLPFRDGSVDHFICTEVLEHLRLGSPLVREFARCLKRTGSVFISVPNAVSLTNRLKWCLGRVPFMAASGDCGHDLGGTGFPDGPNWIAGHVVDFNLSRLIGYLRRGGLVVDEVYSLGAYLGPHLPRLIPRLVPPTLSDFIFVRATKDPAGASAPSAAVSASLAVETR